MLRTHERYCSALSAIGQELGFSVSGLKTDLGNLDCIWRVKGKQLPKNAQNLPLVVFEVICSERQKAMRGSISNMLVAKPALAVFVLVEKEIKRQKVGTSPEKWLNRIRNYVEKLESNYKGILRIDVWTDKDVDKLFYELFKSEISNLLRRN
ncbi:hypothetical protein KY366_05160 [Candidatus Woesearchaeota archaeon]|nr:hypothetical protein [Candidatus Woesearchaeota archaeon]